MEEKKSHNYGEILDRMNERMNRKKAALDSQLNLPILQKLGSREIQYLEFLKVLIKYNMLEFDDSNSEQDAKDIIRDIDNAYIEGFIDDSDVDYEKVMDIFYLVDRRNVFPSDLLINAITAASCGAHELFHATMKMISSRLSEGYYGFDSKEKNRLRELLIVIEKKLEED